MGNSVKKSLFSRSLVPILVIGFILAACTASGPTAMPAQTTTPVPTPTSLPPTQAQLPTPTASPTQQPEPTPTPTQEQLSSTAFPTIAISPTPLATSPTAQECEEKAGFFGDLNIPDGTFFQQDEHFTKTWRFRNEGTCTWTTDYELVFHSGEIMSGPLNQPFPTTVPPGGIVDISVDLVAPSRGGSHQGFWWFEDSSGQRFGTGSNRAITFWVQINVRFLDQNDQPPGDPGSKPPPTPPAGCSAQRDTTVEAQVMSLVNQIRQNNGLASFNTSSPLSEAAYVHSRDMACNRFVDHSGSDGSSWYDRIRAQGYAFSNANENIYVGFPEFGGTAEGAVNWWMNSQVHRDNILKADNVDAGVGYVYDPNSQWGGYYTMVFARP